MTTSLEQRLTLFARDGNLDIEDVDQTIAWALEDGRLDDAEADTLRAAIERWRATMEPAARHYLEDRLAGTAEALVNRVLLARHPRGQQRDLYYARADVVGLQEALDVVGFPTAVDGDFGPGTARSVAAFQASVGLKESGMLDSRTLARLNRALEAADHPPLDLTPRARIRPDAIVAVRGSGGRDVVRRLQQALRDLADHFGRDELRVEVDGAFGPATEAAVLAFQREAYLPVTGIVDTATVAALDLLLEASGRDVVGAAPPQTDHDAGVELHFYPGDAELKVYVLRGDTVLDRYGMVGGRAEARPDEHNPHVDYSPSPAGTYTVVEVSPHASGAWPYSYVPYGAPLREVDGEVDYRDASGRWRRATGPDGVFAARNPPPLSRRAYLDADGQVLPRWTKNDFGHLRARLRSAATGLLQGHMIHSSPFTERTDAYFDDTDTLDDPERALAVLRYSHGCEHIHPRDFDELVAKGYLAPGTRFVIHGYDETFEGRPVSA